MAGEVQLCGPSYLVRPHLRQGFDQSLGTSQPNLSRDVGPGALSEALSGGTERHAFAAADARMVLDSSSPGTTRDARPELRTAVDCSAGAPPRGSNPDGTSMEKRRRRHVPSPATIRNAELRAAFVDGVSVCPAADSAPLGTNALRPYSVTKSRYGLLHASSQAISDLERDLACAGRMAGRN